jgi:hypothetical protein
MSFLVFQKIIKNDKLFYKSSTENFKLAGWNLLYRLWCQKNKPVETGWSVTANDILREHNEDYSSDTHSLVVDFHPNSKERIGLIEIEHIHLYTFGGSGYAAWSPMMWELRDVFYKEEFSALTSDEKAIEIFEIPISQNRPRIVEFLYLNGDDYSWNWGKNGMTNAAFIHEESREYFRKFF